MTSNSPPAGLTYPRADLPPLPLRLFARDEGEQALLEFGGALCALRRRGLPWIAIARAVDLPLADALALARGYALRAAAEFLIEAPAADARSERRWPELPLTR